MSTATELCVHTTCREFLGAEGWCPEATAANSDFCVKHGRARSQRQQEQAVRLRDRS